MNPAYSEYLAARRAILRADPGNPELHRHACPVCLGPTTQAEETQRGLVIRTCTEHGKFAQMLVQVTGSDILQVVLQKYTAA